MEAQSTEKKRAALSMQSPLSADLSTWLPLAQAGDRFVTTAVRELPDECTELDGSVHVLTNMSIMGQLCQSQSDGGIKSVWILACAAGVVSERVNLKSPSPNLTQSQVHEETGNMRLFFTYSESNFWKKKFLHRSLTRDLQAYSEWHREQAGDSPMKRLSSIILLGSPVQMEALDEVAAPGASAVAASWLQSCPSSDVKSWLLSCRSPTAAFNGVVAFLMARLLRSFRHWTCVTMWCQSSREELLRKYLVCGAAEWGVLVKRDDENDPLLNYGYWTSGGDCVLSIEEASLSRWEEGDEQKLGKAPAWEDYDSRCLPIPARLQGIHSFTHS